jgi:hypothetical protein
MDDNIPYMLLHNAVQGIYLLTKHHLNWHALPAALKVVSNSKPLLIKVS